MSLRLLPRLLSPRPALRLSTSQAVLYRPLSVCLPRFDAPRFSPPSSHAAAAAGQTAEEGVLKARWVPVEGSSEVAGNEKLIMDVVPRKQMTFTCTAPVAIPSPDAPPTPAPAPTTPARTVPTPLDPSAPTQPCSHRSTHTFTTQAYTTGTVLIQCPKCKNRHLIADHLGWFKELTKDGKGVDVEAILRERGESVQKGSVRGDGQGTIELY